MLKEVVAQDDKVAGFRVKGPAASVLSTLHRYRALLAPLRFGAGIKGKVLDAWLCHTPVLTSSVGAEGLRRSELLRAHAAPGGTGKQASTDPATAPDPAPTTAAGASRDFGGLVADDPESFAAAAADLYLREPLWQRAQQTGRDTLATFFDHVVHCERLGRALAGTGAFAFDAALRVCVWRGAEAADGPPQVTPGVTAGVTSRVTPLPSTPPPGTSLPAGLSPLTSALNATRRGDFPGQMVWSATLRTSEYFSFFVRKMAPPGLSAAEVAGAARGKTDEAGGAANVEGEERADKGQAAHEAPPLTQ